MNVQVTAPAGAMWAGAQVLLRSLERGDWADEEFEDAAARAAGRFRAAADDADADADLVTVELDGDVADEVGGVLACDAAADTTLRTLVDALLTAGP